MNNVYNILLNGQFGHLTKSAEYSNELSSKPKKLMEELNIINKALLQISSQITFESMKLNKIIVEGNKPVTIKKLKGFYNFKVYQLASNFAAFEEDPNKNSLVITFFDGENKFISIRFTPVKKNSNFTTSINVLDIEKWEGLNFNELRPHRGNKLYSIPTTKNLKSTLEKNMDSLVFLVKTYKELRSGNKSLVGFFKTFNEYINLCGLEKIVREYLFNINDVNYDNKKDNSNRP